MPKPRARIELARTSLGLISVSATYQTTDVAPNISVENPGDRYLGWMSANFLGNALCTAMDNEERAAGRMVVCVEDDADVSTQTISSLPHPDPSTAPPRAFKTSLTLFPLVRNPTPWKDWAANETTT